jgi:hypothetical protein
MPTPPLRPATERFAEILRALGWAVAQQTGWGLSLHLIAVIVGRVQRIKRRFAALAARIAAGTFKPRQPNTAAASTKKLETAPKPPPPNPLPNRPGWLLPLERDAVCHRAQLESLFQDPEMIALLAAAPEAMARVLRPLCRMLALDLPPALAPPKPAPSVAADPPPSARPPARRAARPTRNASLPVVPPRPALTVEFVFGQPRFVWS